MLASAFNGTKTTVLPFGYPRASLSDIPKIIGLAAQKYPGIDVPGSFAWLHRTMRDDDCCVLFYGDCCIVSTVAATFYFPGDKTGHLLMLFGDAEALKKTPMLPFRMLSQVVDWARSKGATKFRFGADTGVDFAPFARRLGARPDTPAYVVDLERTNGR